MTGRRLYDALCDAAATIEPKSWSDTQEGRTPTREKPAPAWPFLVDRDRRVYNEAARRLSRRRSS